ncbi:MAG: hypothetical protein A3H57_02530 [Candidatus Taylorbacteria bacterium RIFCSPLOWO2_02_FULL_43_11]|uniref:Tetratricopeptide repeat-like domain-containing protein n=1 Tax=Candidatus Taylorbacteria bacterium RIFCSPHIGHO2_02_FULL_43_32b TaxID=1802306 RepID=A0A1G2MGG8_9BACT|nr:MAG: hypothetical protein A2743_00285 [Candidatus Taylorbacteria bacterium RIFCSPHIGHO2_01_FULL_43_47]OHA22804.1 MAG: hypothetical protein A3C72_02725 [Candidatus Taylorbacteria bacterium RIFCSPHIGHO2_02_FULL_43_32b]OHA30859.1 MAG: hypothetical protein A3B08_01535 [Candidatus Taylorbacteria bacterium RIFCSPLOWO2_01_FULL_43_44]OHA35255.1 MAG: hypothetical protein A3H57_02530 [Candidatus Taylorbacteria bacterium RIFCSPLOWO2_02_FULL_43_11]
MQDKMKWIFGGFALLVVTGVVLFSGIFKLGEEGENSPVASSTTSGFVSKDGITATGDFTVEPVEETIEIPNLNRPVVFPSDMPNEAREVLKERLDEAVVTIRGDQSSYEGWFKLGVNRKAIEDYVGAKEAWEFASYLYSKDAVLYSNLGNLYGYYLKNTALAETNYLKAVDLEPYIANWYLRTADFYREVVGDSVKAKAILAKGLSMIPGDTLITTALNSTGQ